MTGPRRWAEDGLPCAGSRSVTFYRLGGPHLDRRISADATIERIVADVIGGKAAVRRVETVDHLTV